MHWHLQLAILGGIIISTLDHLAQGRHLFNPFYRGQITKVTKSFWHKVICCVVGGLAAYVLLMIFLYDSQASVRGMATVAFALVPMVHDGRIGKMVEAFDKKP